MASRRSGRADALTLADLVVLSMLAERPMHGYEMWRELMRRDVADWAEISRAQVYYSLRKLESNGCVDPASDRDPAQGPERTRYRPTRAGRAALADALAREEWARETPPAPFLTWMLLSWQARPADCRAQLRRRRDVVTARLTRERATLQAIVAETSASSPAAMVVKLVIRWCEVELEWLKQML